MAKVQNNQEDVKKKILKLINTGIKAATIHLAGRVKELISEPAPRVTLYDKTGKPYYVAGWVKNRPGKTRQIWTGVTYKKIKGTNFRKREIVSYEPSFATPGAPPRKLSGQLRRSIAWEIRNMGAVGRVGTNTVYARRLEQTGHRFLTLALEKYAAEIYAIMGRSFSTGGNL